MWPSFGTIILLLQCVEGRPKDCNSLCWGARGGRGPSIQIMEVFVDQVIKFRFYLSVEGSCRISFVFVV